MLLDIPKRIRVGVFVFDQQPFILAGAASQSHQYEASIQFLAVQAKLQFAPLDLFGRAGASFGFISPLVPNNDLAGSVISRRNRSLKFAVFEWVIFHLDGQALVGWIERRPLRNGPGFQNSANLQAQIVVKPRGGVFLNDKDFLALVSGFPARFRSFGEPPLLSILGQRSHASAL